MNAAVSVLRRTALIGRQLVTSRQSVEGEVRCRIVYVASNRANFLATDLTTADDRGSEIVIDVVYL